MTMLFLYGTLKEGQRNHFRMAGQHYVGPARTLPYYRLYDCGPYPGLVEDRAHGLAIVGELWQVDDAALRRLDEFEGAPLPDRVQAHPEFRRDQVEVEDQMQPIFGYFYCRDVAGLHDCGCEWPTA